LEVRVAELKWGAASHEGQLRSQNEDSFHADDGLFVMGVQRVVHIGDHPITARATTRAHVGGARG
jgi:hypothetical protein